MGKGLVADVHTIVVKSGHFALARLVEAVRHLGIHCLMPQYESNSATLDLAAWSKLVARLGGLGVQLVEFRLALQHSRNIVPVRDGEIMEAMGCLAILCLVVSLRRFNY